MISASAPQDDEAADTAPAGGDRRETPHATLGVPHQRTRYRDCVIEIRSIALTREAGFHYTVHIDGQIAHSAIATSEPIAIAEGVAHAEVMIDRRQRRDEGAE